MTQIYTIGHSNHELEVFLALLRQHDVQLLVDVRSSPYSRYVPHANRESLRRALEAEGITYRWEGQRLGGKPEGDVVDYDKMATRPAFQQGVTDLVTVAGAWRTAIMCSEGDHHKCHRHKLITPALMAREIQVLHIQPDGTLVDEDDEPRQLSLFEVSMPTIYTIGSNKKSLERFIRLLQEAGVDAVIDIRLRNTSQLAGFAKRDDLAFLLREGFGIEYEHRPDLAPTSEILDAYKDDEDWNSYETTFLPMLAERDAAGLGREILSRDCRPCLLCAEPTPDQCHRRLVAEWWAQNLPDMEVVHLI